jgi:hypothetical protein
MQNAKWSARDLRDFGIVFDREAGAGIVTTRGVANAQPWAAPYSVLVIFV